MAAMPHLLATLRTNPALAALLEDFAAVALPDAWIVAGALAQTVWNQAHGLPPQHGIRDIDIIYHDPDDLSAAAEAAHEARLRGYFGDLGAKLDVKNQARVHLWYERRFGRAIPPYPSSQAAIATFPTTATAIGVQPGAFVAPFGTEDLLALRIRPNKVIVSAAVYAAKAARWQALWPKLTVMAWDNPGGEGRAG